MKAKGKKSRGTRSPTDTDITVGANLRQRRHERGITLHQLAELAGISHQQLQKYETGVNRISAGMLPVFAEALGVELMELYRDAGDAGQPRKTKADRLREDCELVLRRVKSEEELAKVLRVLKALTA